MKLVLLALLCAAWLWCRTHRSHRFIEAWDQFWMPWGEQR